MSCIFCQIAQNKVPAKFVMEEDDFVAFKSIDPKAPVHILIVPRSHIPSLNEVSENDTMLLGKMLIAAKQLAEEYGIAKTGYKLVFNVGKDAGMSIAHLHLHLLGGKHLGGTT